MKTVRELIKEAESKLDDEHKDVNVAKVLLREFVGISQMLLRNT